MGNPSSGKNSDQKVRTIEGKNHLSKHWFKQNLQSESVKSDEKWKVCSVGGLALDGG